MTVPIKPELRVHLERLAAQAARTGRNEWDLVNEAGLLYTEPRRRTERSAAIRRAMEHLDTLSVPQLVGGTAWRTGNMTAGDMRKAMMDQLYLISVAMYEGTL